MTSSHDLHIAEGASLVHQLVTATITDEMTHLALHDPGVLSHVLVADGTLWVKRSWDFVPDSSRLFGVSREKSKKMLA